MKIGEARLTALLDKRNAAERAFLEADAELSAFLLAVDEVGRRAKLPTANEPDEPRRLLPRRASLFLMGIYERARGEDPRQARD